MEPDEMPMSDPKPADVQVRPSLVHPTPETDRAGFAPATSLVVGFVAVFASQAELALRSGGDFSFWGFALIGSVMAGLLYGLICLVAGTIAARVARRGRVAVVGRPIATSVIMATALILVTGVFALLAGSAFWLTTAACVAAIAVCAAIPDFGAPWRRPRWNAATGRERPNSDAHGTRGDRALNTVPTRSSRRASHSR